MDPSEITRYKEMAVNAMTGHVPLTPDNLYDMGKALETVCEALQDVTDYKQEALDARETIGEQSDTIADMKEGAKKFAERMKGY